MSVKIDEKLASGEKLTEDEVRYARDHAIVLPEEYGDPTSTQVDPSGTPDPVVETGPAFEQPPTAAVVGPGLFLTPDQLESLKKEELAKLAEVAGFDVSSSAKKEDLVNALAYGEGVIESDDDEDESGDGEGGETA